MRNLKRVLSLALALVMVLGMMVIGTSAATFTDAEEITYTEAVDVISALGIINGFPNEDGTFTFDADATLTRAQGAKIVCYLLMGKDDADQLIGSGEFSDVPADHWAAGSIDYCAAHGILAGNGDGTYNPNGTLTIVQYAKMLLCALGYDAKVEGYVGGNWATAIVTDMIAASLKVKDVDVDAVLTREIAAQMTLQALEAFTVTYPDGKGTDIKLADGTTITIGAGEAVPGTDKLYETLTYATLTKDPVPADENGGLAGYEWNLVGLTAPVHSATTETVKATYESGVKFADIIKALGVKNTANKEYNVEVYRNGVEKTGVYSVVADATFAADTYTGAQLTAAATSFGVIPNGCTVDVVVTNRGTTIRLLVTVPYLAYVDQSSDVVDNDQDDDDERSVTVTNALTGHEYVLYPTDAAFAEVYAAANAIPATSSAKVYYNVVPMGDPAALEPTASYLLSIEPATIETGKMTSYNETVGTYTVGEKVYKLSATAVVDNDDMVALVGKNANYVLDAQGFVVYAEEVGTEAPTAVYAYLRQLVKVTPVADTTGAIGESGAADPYLQAELVFTDGTTKIVTVGTLTHGSGDSKLTYGVGSAADKKLAYKTASSNWQDLSSTTTFDSIFMNKFVSYAVDEYGVYYLASATNAVTGNDVELKAQAIFTTGYVANTKTVFVVETSKQVAGKTVYSYNAYTGYANLPASEYGASDIIGMTKNGVVSYVYIVATPSLDDGSTDGDDTLIYVAGAPEFFYVDGKASNSKDYYVYPVVIDGVASTLKVAKGYSLDTNSLYTITTIDANGYVCEAAKKTARDTVAVKAADTIINLTSAGWKTYDENTVVYVVKNGAVTVGSIADLALSTSIYVEYVQKPVALGGGDSDMIALIVAFPA